MMYISDKEIGKRFSVSRQTVWRWAKVDPSFPSPFRLSAGCTRWKLEEIDAWAAQRAA